MSIYRGFPQRHALVINALISSGLQTRRLEPGRDIPRRPFLPSRAGQAPFQELLHERTQRRRNTALLNVRFGCDFFAPLQKLPEFFRRHARIPNDAAHSKRIDPCRGIFITTLPFAITMCREPSRATVNPAFCQSSYRAKMRYARKLRHALNRNFHFSHVRCLE
jgi:hypothetical protein